MLWWWDSVISLAVGTVVCAMIMNILEEIRQNGSNSAGKDG